MHYSNTRVFVYLYIRFLTTNTWENTWNYLCASTHKCASAYVYSATIMGVCMVYFITKESVICVAGIIDDVIVISQSSRITTLSLLKIQLNCVSRDLSYSNEFYHSTKYT